MTEEEVTRFLQGNPAFFRQHPALFTELLLPDPHQGNAVSLLERQALLLRERVKSLEARLAELLRVGRENDALANNLVEWTKALLAEPDRDRLARVALEQLQRIFAVPLAEIRLWDSPSDQTHAQLARLASCLRAPACGSDIDLGAIGGLPPAWADARSVALIPLRRAAQQEAFGLIALGSLDPARFEAALGTTLLARIGEIASAALTATGCCIQRAPLAAG
ncbi:MAG TPA: DUF484 family protein [Burkholderiaceae bacterium]|nr:DUF484 family protein [Burkholderiaceae bacterium]